MSSPLSQLRAASTCVVAFGGFEFEVGRVSNREMVGVRRYQLLISRLPSETERVVAGEWSKRVLAGADALQTFRELVAEERQIALETMTGEAEQAAEDMRAALLAAGVRRWRPEPTETDPEPAWRPCRIVPDGDPVEGDGASTPDVIPCAMLPGGHVFAQVLASKAISISGCTEVEAARLRTFRGGP